MGSKYKLLDLVAPAIERLCPKGGTVFDVMAGTHSVGYALKKNRRIVANDVQAYSENFGHALLTNTRWGHLRDVLGRDFPEREIRNAEQGWFTEIYKDTYFSEAQCREIEAVRDVIERVNDPQLRSVYLLVLCSAMSLCQSSPGHFAQYMPADHPRLQALRSLSVIEAFRSRCAEIRIDLTDLGNYVFRADALELLVSPEICELVSAGSVLYLDPPYTSAQYSRYYHLLETAVLWDDPEVSFKGLYRPGRHQSPFCSTAQVIESFRQVLGTSMERGWKIVISYSSHGLLPLDELVDEMREWYPVVSVEGASHYHSMQGRGVAKDRTEYVLSGTWLPE